MTIQQLRYVIGIAEAGSFNKAAEKLYISQPSLTSTIHDLEDELGIIISPSIPFHNFLPNKQKNI